MSARTKHGHLVRIWLRLAGSKRSKPITLASVRTYLQADDGFAADFVHLNAEQKLLAMEAVAAALERFRPKAAAPAGRIAWSKSPEWQERVRDAACRLPDGLCPGCFDMEAEKAGVRYSFVELDGMSWSDRPAPKRAPRPKRR
jgi:hypothetical protein